MDLVALLLCGPAFPAAVYTDLFTAIAVIQAHTKAYGYALVKRDS
jgi:hypothetical protein